MYWYSARVNEAKATREALRAFFLETPGYWPAVLAREDDAASPHYHAVFKARCKEQRVRMVMKRHFGVTGNADWSLKEVPEQDVQRALQYICKGDKATRRVDAEALDAEYDVAALNAAYWREWDERGEELRARAPTRREEKPMMQQMLEAVLAKREEFIDEHGAPVVEAVYREVYRWFGRLVRLGINRWKVEDAFQLVLFHLDEESAYKQFVGNKFRENNFDFTGYNF